MTKIRDVGDVRMDSQLNDEDRRAIRRSKQMTLMAVAAVTVAALLSPADESAPRATAGSIASNAAPALSAASIEPTASISDSFSTQPRALPAAFIELAGDRFETRADYPVTGAAGFAREAGGLPNR